MDAIFKLLDQSHVAEAFKQQGSRWSPEVGAKLQKSLALQNIKVKPEQIQEFLTSKGLIARSNSAELDADEVVEEVEEAVLEEIVEEIEEIETQEAKFVGLSSQENLIPPVIPPIIAAAAQEPIRSKPQVPQVPQVPQAPPLYDTMFPEQDGHDDFDAAPPQEEVLEAIEAVSGDAFAVVDLGMSGENAIAAVPVTEAEEEELATGHDTLQPRNAKAVEQPRQIVAAVVEQSAEPQAATDLTEAAGEITQLPPLEDAVAADAANAAADAVAADAVAVAADAANEQQAQATAEWEEAAGEITPLPSPEAMDNAADAIMAGQPEILPDASVMAAAKSLDAGADVPNQPEINEMPFATDQISESLFSSHAASDPAQPVGEIHFETEQQPPPAMAVNEAAMAVEAEPQQDDNMWEELTPEPTHASESDAMVMASDSAMAADRLTTPSDQPNQVLNESQQVVGILIDAEPQNAAGVEPTEIVVSSTQTIEGFESGLVQEGILIEADNGEALLAGETIVADQLPDDAPAQSSEELPDSQSTVESEIIVHDEIADLGQEIAADQDVEAISATDSGDRMEKIAELERQGTQFLQRKKFPEAINTWLEIGLLEERPDLQDQVANAEQQMQRAKQLWENAQFLAECDKERDAIQVLKQCLDVYPYHESALQLLKKTEAHIAAREAKLFELFAKGQKILQEKEFHQAKQIWDEGQALLAPETPEFNDWEDKTSRLLQDAYLTYGRDLFQNKELEKCQELWREALQILPEADELAEESARTDAAWQEAQHQCSQARKFFERFDLGKAQESLFACQKVYPTYQAAKNLESLLLEAMARETEYHNLIKSGERYAGIKNFPQAIVTWQKALGLIPDDSLAYQKIKEAEQALAVLKHQHDEYDRIWAEAEEAERQAQYEKAFDLVSTLHSVQWAFEGYDAPKQNAFFNRLNEIREKSLLVAEQIKKTTSRIKQHKIGETQRILASKVFQQPVTESVQKELQAARENLVALARQKAVLRQVMAASLIILIGLWQTFAGGLLPLLHGKPAKIDTTQPGPDTTTPEPNAALLALQKLQTTAEAAMASQEWDTAKALYLQITPQVDQEEQTRIAGLLSRIEQEQKFTELLRQTKTMAENKDWPAFRNSLRELKKIKSDFPELLALEASVPPLSAEEKQRLSLHGKKLGEYRQALQTEMGKLDKVVKEYEKNIAIAKYVKLPPELEQLTQKSKTKLDQSQGFEAQIEKTIAAIGRPEIPNEIELLAVMDHELIKNLQAAFQKTATVIKEGKRLQGQETTSRKAFAYLQTKAAEVKKQSLQLQKNLQQLKNDYPANKGFTAAPGYAEPLAQKAVQAERELDLLTTSFNKALEAGQHSQYAPLVEKVKQYQSSSLGDDLQKAIRETEAVLAKNQAWAKKLATTAAAGKNRDDWLSQNPNLGRKALGEWFDRFAGSLAKFQKIPRQSIKYMPSQGTRKIYFLLTGRVPSLQNLPQNIEQLEWKIFSLGQTQDLLEVLARRKKEAMLPAQIKQINALKRYIGNHKFDLDVASYLDGLESAVAKLQQELAAKNIEEETMRDFNRNLQRIEESFWEQYRLLDSELANIESQKNE